MTVSYANSKPPATRRMPSK